MDVAASWATYRASAGGGPLDFGKQIVGVVGNPLSSVIREGVTVLDLRDRVLLQGGKQDYYNHQRYDKGLRRGYL